ncbi:GntR family transcriptional regulator [Salininema proteolyticum]|uniref:GntR family transcriptional regulator n=1 Tax=Salininema proteolyticum TaxID=1607685 RepID=A0ABV8TWL4_9ACTN
MIEVDAASPVPPYEQIRSQIALLIDTGGLGEGHRLPTVRQLAADLGLAPNTVARAYKELEAQGYTAAKSRKGTTVVGPQNLASEPFRHDLQVEADAFVRKALGRGAAPESIVDAVRRALQQG